MTIERRVAMENDYYSRTVTADGFVDTFIPGEIVEFARQNKAVKKRMEAREREYLLEQNKMLDRQKRAAKKAAKAERKRQRRVQLASGMIIGTAVMLVLMLGGLVDQTVGTLAIAAGMAVGGYRLK